MPREESISSPRLAALQQALAAGEPEALATFWREVGSTGAPLIEPDPADPERRLVTFLWRATAPVENVIVVGELVGSDYAANRLARLGDSDLWYKTYRWRTDLRTCYELAPDDPLTPDAALADEAAWRARTAGWQPDPLNPRRYQVNIRDAEDPDSQDKWLSVLELPGALPQPWVAPQPGGPAGCIADQRMRSRLLDKERRVWVYTPPEYGTDGAPYPLLVLMDGIPYLRLMHITTTLDNMITAGALPPLVAVLMDNPNRMADLTHPTFPAFVTHELVPWAETRYHLTREPARRIIGGTSLGGLAAARIGLGFPDVFGNVLSQSGAFFGPFPEPLEAEPEGLARAYAAAPLLPLRWYLDVGLLERGVPPDLDWPGLLTANRHLRDVLRAKGYPVHYQEYNGGHNYICWQGTIADGLRFLLAPLDNNADEVL